MCDYEIVTKALISYRKRWKIEEVHRHFKQSYGWEDMRLMTFTRLQNLNVLLLIAMSFLYSLDQYILELGELYQRLIYDTKKIKDIPEFIYYRLSLVIKELFRDWRLQPRYKYQGEYTKREQMAWA